MVDRPHECLNAHKDELVLSGVKNHHFEPPLQLNLSPVVGYSNAASVHTQRTLSQHSRSGHNLAFSHHISRVGCGMSNSLSFFFFSRSSCANKGNRGVCWSDPGIQTYKSSKCLSLSHLDVLVPRNDSSRCRKQMDLSGSRWAGVLVIRSLFR